MTPFAQALAALPTLAPPLIELFASFLKGAGLHAEQIEAMAIEYKDALRQLGAGASAAEIAAGPARYAQPLGDDALFAKLFADAEAPPTHRDR